jgi:hypothetical protein
VVTAIRADGGAVAPTWEHAVEAYLAAHGRAGAWSPGTVVKYRQTLTGLTPRLADAPAPQ